MTPNLTDLIHKEARLEGIDVTYEQVKNLCNGTPVGSISTTDIMKINNLKFAWQFVFDTLDAPITLSYVSQVNFFIESGLRADCGELRHTPVTMGGTTWVPEMPNREKAASDIANITDPFIMCAYLMRSQLFIDGNKRTAQLVANQMLLSQNKGTIAIPEESLDKFRSLLIDYYETNELISLTNFLKEYVTCHDRQRLSIS